MVRVLSSRLSHSSPLGASQHSPPGQATRKPVTESNGLWTDKDGAPTYNIAKDGTVDWGTFIGYLRYNDTCLRCHGPDGAGSSYAPDLTQSLQQIGYSQFIADVAGGIKSVNTAQQLVMPAFAERQECDVLHPGNLQLPEGSFDRCPGPRPTGKDRSLAEGLR